MKPTSSLQAVRGRALQRASGSQEGTEKPLGCQVLKRVLSIQKCAEQSGEDRFARGYRGTIREDRGSSKVGKKSMCKKGAKSPAKRRVDHTPERSIETSWSSTVHERHPLALRNDAFSRNRNRWERSRNGWAVHFYRRIHQKRRAGSERRSNQVE